MSLIGLLFLLACHYLMGYGLLSFFKPGLNRVAHIALSFIAGVVLTSLVPFFIELAKVRISVMSVGTGMIALTVLVNIKNAKTINEGIRSFSLNKLLPSFRVYEWPFMILFTVLFISSVWRAFYFPPNARDMLSGPEPIAEYAVREGSMINSVLTLSLETTNNHQKPPFVTCLQIVYKLFGFPFGQLWLSVICIAFIVFMYQALKQVLHPLLACVLTMLFVTVPELYAYTYVMLFDYSNMVLFFLGFYFLIRYFQSEEQRDFYLSVVLFAFATYIRLETVILIALALPALWLNAFTRKHSMLKTLVQSGAMLAASFAFYFLWVNVFLKYYMPVQFKLDSQINPKLSDLSPIATRIKDMNKGLLFGGFAEQLWGYFMYFAPAFIVLDLIIKRKMSAEYRNWLYAIAVVYFGLPIIGYLLPLADLLNTTKRGLFKMVPAMIMVMAHSASLQQLSAAITKWENELPEQKPAPAPAPVRTAQKNTKKKGKA